MPTDPNLRLETERVQGSGTLRPGTWMDSTPTPALGVCKGQGRKKKGVSHFDSLSTHQSHPFIIRPAVPLSPFCLFCWISITSHLFHTTPGSSPEFLSWQSLVLQPLDSVPCDVVKLYLKPRGHNTDSPNRPRRPVGEKGPKKQIGR